MADTVLPAASPVMLQQVQCMLFGVLCLASVHSGMMGPFLREMNNILMNSREHCDKSTRALLPELLSSSVQTVSGSPDA